MSIFLFFHAKIFVRLFVLSINDDNLRLVRLSLDNLVVREIFTWGQHLEKWRTWTFEEPSRKDQDELMGFKKGFLLWSKYFF